MLSKEEHINFWKLQAEDDWEVVEALFTVEKFSQSLFWAHLVLEKYCKALWVRDNETNVPPKTHNLIHLFSQTKLEITDEQKEFLLEVNRFQIEGRYPDYVTKMNELCTKDFTEKHISQIKNFKEWLRGNL